VRRKRRSRLLGRRPSNELPGIRNRVLVGLWFIGALHPIPETTLTCCLAAKCDSGVVLASDALLSVGDSRVYAQGIKARDYGSLRVLYAGSLAQIDKLFSEYPSAKTKFSDLQQFQQRIWNMKDELVRPDEAYEFLAVDASDELHILSGHGDVVSGFTYACAGSELGWLGLDLVMPDARNDSASAIKSRLLKVLRAVAKRDSTVSAPFFTEVV